MFPRICEGDPDGSVILLNAIHWLALLPAELWSNFTVVSRPTLKVSQSSMASCEVCLIVTFVLPADVVVCTGFSAPTGEPVSFNPPVPSPLGTGGRNWPGALGLGRGATTAPDAAARALACMAFTAFSA